MANYGYKQSSVNLDEFFLSSNATIKFEPQQIWSWGRFTGDNTTIIRSSPVQTVTSADDWYKIASYSDFSKHNTGNSLNVLSVPYNILRVAIKKDGTLWTWGENRHGQLGDGTTISRSSPVQIGTSTWKEVAVGNTHILAIKTDGSLWSWGQNGGGVLGLGDMTDTFFGTPINDRSSPVQVGSDYNWKKIACAEGQSKAIKSDGTLWGWGGLLGDGTTISRSSPVQIGSDTDWKKVVCSGGGFHTGAIKENGTMWMWGYNNAGQLGDNTTISRSSPVQVLGDPSNDWIDIDINSYNSSGIKANGSGWIWGQPSSQSGAFYPVPVSLASLSGIQEQIKKIVCPELVLTKKGTLYAQGEIGATLSPTRSRSWAQYLPDKYWVTIDANCATSLF